MSWLIVVVSFSMSAVPPILEVFSHRAGDILPEARNQGKFCTCGIFAVTSAVEAAVAHHTGVRASYSRQQVVDHIVPTEVAPPNFPRDYFPGTSISSVVNYVKDVGLVAENEYRPYDGLIRPIPLDLLRVAVKISSYELISNAAGFLEKRDAIRSGMVVGVMRNCWQSFHRHIGNGVYKGPIASEVRRGIAGRPHAVLVTGFGVFDGMFYYEVLNSAGVARGDQGFVKVAMKLITGFCRINGVEVFPH